MKSTRHLRSASIVGLVTVAAFGLSACSGDKAADAAPITSADLTGSWQLVSGKGPDGEIKALDEPITANFETEDTISTTVGCNNIFGSVEVGEAGQVTMGPLAMTMMMCEEPLMELETKYAAALELVDQGQMEGDHLVFTGSDTRLEYSSDAG